MDDGKDEEKDNFEDDDNYDDDDKPYKYSDDDDDDIDSYTDNNDANNFDDQTYKQQQEDNYSDRLPYPPITEVLKPSLSEALTPPFLNQVPDQAILSNDPATDENALSAETADSSYYIPKYISGNLGPNQRFYNSKDPSIANVQFLASNGDSTFLDENYYNEGEEVEDDDDVNSVFEDRFKDPYYKLLGTQLWEHIYHRHRK